MFKGSIICNSEKIWNRSSFPNHPKQILKETLLQQKDLNFLRHWTLNCQSNQIIVFCQWKAALWGDVTKFRGGKVQFSVTMKLSYDGLFLWGGYIPEEIRSCQFFVREVQVSEHGLLATKCETCPKWQLSILPTRSRQVAATENAEQPGNLEMEEETSPCCSDKIAVSQKCIHICFFLCVSDEDLRWVRAGFCPNAGC